MLTSQVQLIMPAHVNQSNRLFGGQLMSWIDIVAAVEARRHAKRLVITASVDQLEFLAPATLGDMVRIEARVTWTGRTSLEVLTESYVESLSGVITHINRAYLVFVALDDAGRPTEIEPFVPTTDQEKADWDSALERREYRLSHRS